MLLGRDKGGRGIVQVVVGPVGVPGAVPRERVLEAGPGLEDDRVHLGPDLDQGPDLQFHLHPDPDRDHDCGVDQGTITITTNESTRFQNQNRGHRRGPSRDQDHDRRFNRAPSLGLGVLVERVLKTKRLRYQGKQN